MPYRFVPPSGKFGTVNGSVSITVTFAQPENIKYHTKETNATNSIFESSTDGTTWTTWTDGTNVTVRYMRFTIIQIIQTANLARVKNLTFMDKYRRRVHPIFTQSSSVYYTAQPIAQTPTYEFSSNPTQQTFTFDEDVIVEYVLTSVPTTIGTVTLDDLKTVSSSGPNISEPTSGKKYIINVSPGTPKVSLFDTTCSPLTDASFIGGSPRNLWNDWVEVTFAQSIPARSYSFKTPDITVFPTWFRIEAWNGTSWVPLDEVKHKYVPYTLYASGFTQNISDYSRYRIVIKAMSGSTAAELIEFNLHDVNGSEFIQTYTNNTKSTNAPIVSATGFVKDTVYTNEQRIEFRIPVQVIKVVCADISGSWSIRTGNDTVIGTLSTGVYYTGITAPVLSTVYKLVATSPNSQIKNVELHGTRGRLNPSISSTGVQSDVFGGQSLVTQSVSVNLPTAAPIFGNHYQVTTTSAVSIVGFTLNAYTSSSTIAMTIAQKSNIYPLTQTIQGNFIENGYIRYELIIDEISTSTTKKSVDITEFTILSNTYTSIIPIFTGERTPDTTRELSTSIHGTYNIQFTGSTADSFSNIFDKDPSSLFSTAGNFNFTVTFPYPSQIRTCYIAFSQAPSDSWTLYGDDTTLLATGATTTTAYTGLTTTFSSAKLVVSSLLSGVRLSDFRLFNASGDFIPILSFGEGQTSATSTRTQWVYGGSGVAQTITYTLPDLTPGDTVHLGTIEFVGSSLPSNVIVRDSATNTLLGQSDSFYGRCVTQLSGTSRSFTVSINRIRPNTNRYQNIRVDDIIIRDDNGYILTPLTYPQLTHTSSNTNIAYTLTTGTRTGYIYPTILPSMRMEVDNLQNAAVYGYRGIFPGARIWDVYAGTELVETVTLQAQYSGVYSNSWITPRTTSNISVHIRSTFPGYNQASIGNFNVFNQYYEAILHPASGPLWTGGTSVNSGGIQVNGVNAPFIRFTFPDSTTSVQTINLQTSYPSRCILTGTNDNISFTRISDVISNPSQLTVPYGLYTVYGGSPGAFMDTYSIIFLAFDTGPKIFGIHLPKRTYISTVSFQIPNDDERMNLSFTLPIVRINGQYSTTIPSNQLRNTDITVIIGAPVYDIQFSVEYAVKTNVGTSYKIALSKIRINGKSLKEFGVAYGTLIRYTPPLSQSIQLTNVAFSNIYVSFVETYNELNSGDGSLVVQNVQFINSGENFFGDFTGDTKDVYRYNPTDTVTGTTPQWVEMNLGAIRTIREESYEWDTNTYSAPKNHVLQVFDTNGWVTVTSLPIRGRRFRRYVPEVTQFKKNGQIRLKNWILDQYPSVYGTLQSNVFTRDDIIEEPSFTPLNGTLNTSSSG